MFWRKAHSTYGHVDAGDEDIKKFQEASSEIQINTYRGIVGFVLDLGHRWVSTNTGRGRTLEIGFGSGRHSLFYSGKPEDYFVCEYSKWHLKADAWHAFRGRGVQGDGRILPFGHDTFQTIISIYNLEHISNLKPVFREVHRVLNSGGRFLICLPCEGGFLWNIGREISTRRWFQKKYGINYDKVIAYEHVWDYNGVIRELKNSGLFRIEQQKMLPLFVQTHHLNLVSCLECSKILYDQ